MNYDLPNELKGARVATLSTFRPFFVESGLIMAGPTNPLDPRRTKGVKVVKFTEEHLQLKCEWIGCEYITRFLHEFMAHVAEHTPAVVISNEPKRTVKGKWNKGNKNRRSTKQSVIHSKNHRL
jgi:hypothetical protein